MEYLFRASALLLIEKLQINITSHKLNTMKKEILMRFCLAIHNSLQFQGPFKRLYREISNRKKIWSPLPATCTIGNKIAI